MSTIRRRPRLSSTQAGRPRTNNSTQVPPNKFNSRLPSFIILSSFLIGWLLGRHESARGIGIKVTVSSYNILKSLTNTFLIFYGLRVHNECESTDGKLNNVAYCSISQLLGKLMRTKSLLERHLQSSTQYGTYYQHIFNDISTKPSSDLKTAEDSRKAFMKRQLIPTPIFLATSDSMKKLSRRILMKHLQAVIREQQSATSIQSIPKPTFTWITGGDSSAAGHGNLLSQSYTSILQETVQHSFEQLGIQFQAKNYGMGQYSSGPELALCINEVYGTDIDILMWDFASLQSSQQSKSEPVRKSVLWSNRAAMHPTSPILFSYDNYGERFESLGAKGSILMDAFAMDILKERLPDSNVIVNLPDGLSNYHCGPSFEGGVKCEDSMRNFVCYLDDEIAEGVVADAADLDAASICREMKFKTKPECLDARYQASWHPGWKDHMLKGRLIGQFLINALEEALYELDQLKNQHGDDPQKLLEYYEYMEQTDRQQVLQKPVDTTVWDKDVVFARMGSKLVLTGESICHTALLPSKSRLEGLTTEAEENGEFDKGVNQFLMSTPEDGVLPLAFDGNDRQQCEHLEVDHKDFFLVREQDGWVSTTVPNNRELEVYPRSTEPEGIIVLCLKICPLGKCPDAYISIKQLPFRTKLFITVDGKTVANIKKLDTCHILAGDNSNIRWGKKGQYELGFRINDPGTLHVLKISSIIVF